MQLLVQKRVSLRNAHNRLNILRERDVLAVNEMGTGGFSSPPCPYLVLFFDAFVIPEEQNFAFLIEYMNANTLEDLVKDGATFSETSLRKIAYSLLRALDYLHTRRFIHRDIKPANILLNHFDQVKVADFGVSCQFSKHASQLQEQPSRWVDDSGCLGTAAYMSPERLTSSTYSYNSDIWSVGMVILFLILGKHPITYRNAHDLRVAVPIFTPQIPTSYQLSPAFHELIALMLNRDPRMRPSARELLQHPVLAENKAEANMAPQLGPIHGIGPATKNDRIVTEAIDIAKKVQFHRYKAAMSAGQRRLEKIPAHRLEYLAQQVCASAALMTRLFDYFHSLCDIALSNIVCVHSALPFRLEDMELDADTSRGLLCAQ
jgi:mitogen-activated protein kinase kinase 1